MATYEAELAPLLQQYSLELRSALAHIDTKALAACAIAIKAAWQADRFMFVCGNGGSATTAAHFAADLSKNAKSPTLNRLRIISLAENPARLTAIANDLDYSEVFAEQLRVLCRAGDLVLALSCSGKSRNIIAALRVARALDAYSIAITSNEGAVLCDYADVCLCVPAKTIEQQEDLHHIICHFLVSLASRGFEGTTELAASGAVTEIVIAGNGG